MVCPKIRLENTVTKLEAKIAKLIQQDWINIKLNKKKKKDL